MARQDDISHPSDSYFEHSLTAGKNGAGGMASVILSRDRVTFIVPSGELAKSGLEEIRKINDLLGNPTTVREGNGNYALTTITPDQATTALFFARHLENTGVIGSGATSVLESELARSDHLSGPGHSGAEAATAPEGGNMHAAREQAKQAQISGMLTTAMSSAADGRDPARDKVISIAAAKDPGGRGLG